MGREERLKIIKKLENKRNSKLFVYITGDRQNVATKIGTDVLHMFQDILIKSDIADKSIDLLIYSRGGEGIAALGLVTLIREYCSNFSVIVPYRAHSAATLITLGANSILMLKSGQLSPVDVNITTPFNPLAPNKQFLPINVEDLSGYINFAKDIGITREQYLTEALKSLTSKVNPIALGAVHRAREKNYKIASSLLEYHMNDKKLVRKISDIITRGLYQHSFLIGKRDAINLGLPVEQNSDEIEKSIWSLFSEYSDILKLNEPMNQEALVDDSNQKIIDFHGAIIEHITDGDLETYTFTFKKELIRKSIMNPQFGIALPQIIEKVIEQCWIKNDI